MATVHQFRTNLNCGSCVAAVKDRLDSDSSIQRWSVDTDDPDKVLTVEGENVSMDAIVQHIAGAGFRVLGPVVAPTRLQLLTEPQGPSAPPSTETYRPLLLLLAYIVGLVLLVEVSTGTFAVARAMANFMGGFFVAFSFFKMLNLRGFVDAFQSYDVVARPFRPYGYAYPFVELALGVAYLVGFAPLLTNSVTLVVMSVGIIGVSQALVRKRKIQCACLGTVFNLPMSKVTFFEDALMAAMALAMLGMTLSG